MGIAIWIIAIGVVWWLVANGIKQRKQREAEDNTFAGEHSGWDIYVSPYGRQVLALDHGAQRFAVGTVNAYIERPWSDISAVEIERDGQTLSQTNRGSQVMGAAVGAVLLGPLGLLMGGLTGSRRQKARVNELCLKLMIDNRTAPIHRIAFFRMPGKGVDPNSVLLKAPVAKLEHFHALVSNAIRHDNRAFAKQGSLPAIEENTTDRLAKLWELRQAGALTEAEFVSEKKAILSLPQLPSL